MRWEPGWQLRGQQRARFAAEHTHTTSAHIAGLLGVCGAGWKRGGKEAVTGIQCNSIVCKATCPAALRQKERNRIAFATAERVMDLSGWRTSAKKFRAH